MVYRLILKRTRIKTDKTTFKAVDFNYNMPTFYCFVRLLAVSTENVSVWIIHFRRMGTTKSLTCYKYCILLLLKTITNCIQCVYDTLFVKDCGHSNLTTQLLIHKGICDQIGSNACQKSFSDIYIYISYRLGCVVKRRLTCLPRPATNDLKNKISRVIHHCVDKLIWIYGK